MARPPRRARGSTTGRPIMALLDLLGRRWTLRVLWELRGGPLASRALRAACGDLSPTVLQARVRELREAGLVALDPAGYALTPMGVALGHAFEPLGAFAETWARDRPAPE